MQCAPGFSQHRATQRTRGGRKRLFPLTKWLLPLLIKYTTRLIHQAALARMRAQSYSQRHLLSRPAHLFFLKKNYQVALFSFLFFSSCTFDKFCAKLSSGEFLISRSSGMGEGGGPKRFFDGERWLSHVMVRCIPSHTTSRPTEESWGEHHPQRTPSRVYNLKDKNW